MIRRELLLLLGAAVLAELAGCRRKPLPMDPRREALVGTRIDRKAAAAVGRAWRNDLEFVPNVTTLTTELYGPARPGADERQTVLRHLESLHRDDLQAGRMVEVDGWMLSLTEARLYLLIALVEEAA
jgi:hypothetical protein